MHPGVHSRRDRRLPVVFVAVATFASLVFSGCSEQGRAEQIDSPMNVSTRNASVALENRADRPLDNITLTVMPFGRAGTFSKSLPRLERAERREMPLAQFLSPTGAAFNPMLIRPRQVRVTATDAAGTQYGVELPWK